MSRPQVQGENAVLVVLVALQDVGLQLERAVVGDEAGIAVDGHQPEVALFGHQRPNCPAALADRASRLFVDGHDARLFRQPLGFGRQLAFLDEIGKERRLVGVRGEDEHGQDGQESSEGSHA